MEDKREIKKTESDKNKEINELAIKAQHRDEKALNELLDFFKLKINKIADGILVNFILDYSYKEQVKEDMIQRGWEEFVSALKNYDPENDSEASFKTYVYNCIRKPMIDELGIQLNRLGIKDMPKEKRGKIISVSIDDEEIMTDALEKEISDALKVTLDDEILVDKAPNLGDYSTERLTLQIVDLLRMYTDENNPISMARLEQILALYQNSKYQNGTMLDELRERGERNASKKKADAPSETFKKRIAEILFESNPSNYSDSNDEEFRIKYEGYDSDELQKKVNYQEDNCLKLKTAPVINGLSYVHDFDNATLDKLIQIVSFSDMLTSDEKVGIINKLKATASIYFKTPFFSDDRIKFNPKTLQSRFSSRNGADRSALAENLKIIQEAINNLAQIRFTFNQYTADHTMIPKGEYKHEVSPYHLVVYHDNYYCICLSVRALKNEKPKKQIMHYRVDLMSDIEIIRDENGEPVTMEAFDFAGLPIFNPKWNPEQYMAEHLNMAYDEPREIKIKIASDNYTILHDWFGDNYSKIKEKKGIDEFGKEVMYDTVVVKTSPFMMTHWAMQYGTYVEILDEEIREKIRCEIERLTKQYAK